MVLKQKSHFTTASTYFTVEVLSNGSGGPWWILISSAIRKWCGETAKQATMWRSWNRHHGKKNDLFIRIFVNNVQPGVLNRVSRCYNQVNVSYWFFIARFRSPFDQLRIGSFKEIARIADTELTIEEIAGNDEIVVSVIARKNAPPVANTELLYTSRIVTTPDLERHVYL